MTLAIQAARSAEIARNDKPHNLQVGDRVKIIDGDYYNQVGTITKVGTNLLGLPLVDVKIDGSEDGAYEPCAYPHEVEKIDA